MALLAIAPDLPEPLRLYESASWEKQTFPEEKCFSDEQKQRVSAISARLNAAYERLAAAYGRDAVEDAEPFVAWGPVRVARPCDAVGDAAALDRYEGAVAALEVVLTDKMRRR